MPITNQPNLAALQAAIISELTQAITDSQTAVIANSDSNAAAVVTHVTDETGAAATALAGEIATKATETQAAVDAAATATQGTITAKGAVKSVQRGTVTVTNGTSPLLVNISAVNQSKSELATSWNLTNGAMVRFVSSTQIEVYTASSSNNTVTWQVIEYE